MARRHSVMFWIRLIHRWTSMVFVVTALVVIFALPVGSPAGDVAGGIALALVVVMAITGIWMAVHHYAVRLRAPRRVSVSS